MSSYLRQAVNTELMHDFLKDKQAWEHAIAMYQGPDPLDHWYNYVCWYENFGHGDPENKFRETLERCLSTFEHSDYYKQDMRMLRLWLKYIDMQPNPHHFYQTLYQRGVARQIALFYISWGSYFETLHALKEAESVYNLGFQEKAQPYAELQHALVKVMYSRATIQQQEQQQQQQQQQQKVVQEQQVSYQNNHAHEQQQQQPQHAYQRAQLAYVQQQQQHGSRATEEHVQTNDYHTVYMQQNIRQQQQEQSQQQQQQEHHYHAPHAHLPQVTEHLQHHHTMHTHHQDPQSHHHQHNHQHQQQHLLHVHQEHTHYHTHDPNQVNHTVQQEEHVTAATKSATNNGVQEIFNQQQQQQSEQINYVQTIEQEQQHNEQVKREAEEEAATNEIPANKLEYGNLDIKLPKRFVNCARNNHETWKPALCLDELPDPMRKCHYPKNEVYPSGAGFEYSPEELRLKKYMQTRTVSQTLVENVAYSLQATGVVEQENKNQNGQSPAYDSSSSSDKEDNYGFSEREDELPDELCEEPYEDDAEDDDEDDEEEDGEEEEEDDEEEQVFKGTVVQNHYQQEVGEQDKQKRAKVNSYSRQYNDKDEQIEASTIHLANNKSIKIKFKKERVSNDINGANGNNYSAYKIESIYQQEISLPKTPVSSERRNGHNFHPYLLGQTSTPKISGSLKRHKTKLKHHRHENEFSQNYLNESNSSTADREILNAVVTNVTANNSALSSNDNAVQNANFNDNANYSFSSAVTLDNSNCSISSAVGRLNFKDTSVIGLNNSQLNVTNQSTLTTSKAAVTSMEISTFQENSYFATQYDTEAKERRLHKALETIERHLCKSVIDPFNSELCRAFLTKLNFPASEHDDNAVQDNYKIIQTPLPKIANTKVLNLVEGVSFNIDKEVGRGSYGSVYKATDTNTGATVALKYQKPPNTWEIYICDQVLKRITSPSVLPGLMDISTAIIAPNASLIATEFSPFGSLLDINNKIRQATTKVMHESLVMHFSAQICKIVHYLHEQKIIHADIKPDNFLLMRVPNIDLHYPSLRLIDFGCAIDMTLFPDPDNTKFRKVIQTDGFTCIEMQEGRPWSYETDLFCVAGTIHVMLFGEYMQAQKRGGSWDIKQKLPRYLKKHVWTCFFGDMLNIKPNKLPNLNEMRRIFEEEAARMDSELQKQIRTLSNILYRR